MHKFYKNYYWKNGKPYGKEEVDPAKNSFSYRIVTDPYFKRFSIEKYKGERFEAAIYDSLLLDFRHLTEKDQQAWQREIVREDEIKTICLLRNHDDRAVLMETLTYENNFCRRCLIASIHGITLATQRMYYTVLKDLFNGVILYDRENRPVMRKIYAFEGGEFTQLLKEEWDLSNFDPIFI